MDMDTYCYKKGMDFEQFEQYQKNIRSTADAMVQYIKSMYIVDNGIYHSIKKIFPTSAKHDAMQVEFIIQELKKQGVEFMNNNKEWRL